jgi:hypothetical protein
MNAVLNAHVGGRLVAIDGRFLNEFAVARGGLIGGPSGTRTQTVLIKR